MVFGVFENMIADLEEMERREHRQTGERRDRLGKSEIEMPSMDHKTDENVRVMIKISFFIFLV